MHVHANVSTKRNILSILAGLSDPVGLTSPAGVRAKCLFQDLCKESLGWDAPIPQERMFEWNQWNKEVGEVSSVKVQRNILKIEVDEILHCELHGFGDASKKAYCATVYLVYYTKNGVFSNLLCAKTRVAPKKETCIPWLELLSARILSTLMDNVLRALTSQLKIDNVRYWLDSKTASFGYTIKENGKDGCSFEFRKS